MRESILFSALLFTVQVNAATECLSFIKDWQGRSVAWFDRQIITEPEVEMGTYDGITLKVLPERADFKNISVYLINDGRKQLRVGETVWLSAEILSKSNKAYWVLVDCAPAGSRHTLRKVDIEIGGQSGQDAADGNP